MTLQSRSPLAWPVKAFSRASRSAWRLYCRKASLFRSCRNGRKNSIRSMPIIPRATSRRRRSERFWISSKRLRSRHNWYSVSTVRDLDLLAPAQAPGGEFDCSHRVKLWQTIPVRPGGRCMLAGLIVTQYFLGCLGVEPSEFLAEVGEVARIDAMILGTEKKERHRGLPFDSAAFGR